MFKIHVLHNPYDNDNHSRLLRLLSEGYTIVRSDSTRTTIVYILEKK